MPLLLALLLTIPDPAKLTAIFTAAHEAGNFDGVAVITVDGKTIVTSALGYADRTAKTPMRPNTLFRLGSLTKQVTALLVMQQLSAGRLQLDQQAGTATIRQLLTHVSGLPNPSDGPENQIPPFYLQTANIKKPSLAYCANKPKRQPGGQFEYNNCDYIVLGAFLESLTGKSYPKLVRKKVIKPLDLKSWQLAPPNPARAPTTAIGYDANGKPDQPQNPATYGAAGAMLGNALDVAKWNTALLTHRLLSAEATETMFRADPKLYGEALGSWAYDMKLGGQPVHIIERQGDIGSTRLLSLLLPAMNASIVIIANTERADLFDTYSKKGLGYQVLKAWFE